ncbi:hypothetical protein GQ43DRAFT_33255 [Delitschia confertaspora ATCC 74209]|uniref:Uncharacterized protein n=1 Tax=Delitschia confertaspora ATCC 74209 TaxID=1513339 RepID=A0A9P4JLC0_9PLEO|nr:hypothetical protein GQ43DRAFT_33255 [Delitschia confertaspora ATCC 74209]
MYDCVCLLSSSLLFSFSSLGDYSRVRTLSWRFFFFSSSLDLLERSQVFPYGNIIRWFYMLGPLRPSPELYHQSGVQHGGLLLHFISFASFVERRRSSFPGEIVDVVMIIPDPLFIP